MGLTTDILLEVFIERERQDKLWGDQSGKSSLVWNAILSEEVGEAAREVNELNPIRLRQELIQVAAVAVAWIEKLDKDRLMEIPGH